MRYHYTYNLFFTKLHQKNLIAEKSISGFGTWRWHDEVQQRFKKIRIYFPNNTKYNFGVWLKIHTLWNFRITVLWATKIVLNRN